MTVLNATLTGGVEAELTAVGGQTIAVVGPNGAGKTTLLRSLAGLSAPAVARVVLDGTDVTGLPPQRRAVGWVPQDGALFPHLDALANVAYGRRARGEQRDVAERVARAWLDRLGVGDLAGRRPATLSGGQAQRVALARALATEPRLLLLDEPLAALDRATRTDVRRSLREHLAGFPGVCFLVSHDPAEALTLANRVLAIEDGRIVQDATPQEITLAPRSAWVARLFGWNAFSGTSTSVGLRVGTTDLVVAEPLPAGQAALATVHPSAVALHLHRPEGSPRNVFRGRVREVVPTGSLARVHVSPVAGSTGLDVVSEVTVGSVTSLGLHEDAAVWVSVKAAEVQLVPA